MTPIELYRESAKAVPAVRYALGVAGITAVLALIAALNLDAWTLALGVPAVLVAMVLLVLFARFSVSRSKSFHGLALAFAWSFFGLGLFISVLGTTSLFFCWPVKLTSVIALPSSVTLARASKWLSETPAFEVAQSEQSIAAFNEKRLTWLASVHDVQPSDHPASRIKLVSEGIVIDAFVRDLRQLQKLQSLKPGTPVIVRGTLKMPYPKLALRLIDCEVSELGAENQGRTGIFPPGR